MAWGSSVHLVFITVCAEIVSVMSAPLNSGPGGPGGGIIGGSTVACITGYISQNGYEPCLKLTPNAVNGEKAAAECAKDDPQSTLAVIMDSNLENWILANILQPNGYMSPYAWVGAAYDCDKGKWSTYYGEDLTSWYMHLQYLQDLSPTATAFRPVWDYYRMRYELVRDSGQPHQVLCEMAGSIGKTVQLPELTCSTTESISSIAPSSAARPVYVASTADFSSTTAQLETRTTTVHSTSTSVSSYKSTVTLTQMATETVNVTPTTLKSPFHTETIATCSSIIYSTITKGNDILSIHPSDVQTIPSTTTVYLTYTAVPSYKSTVTLTQMSTETVYGTPTTLMSLFHAETNNTCSSIIYSTITTTNDMLSIHPSEVQTIPSTALACQGTNHNNKSRTPENLIDFLQNLTMDLAVEKASLSSTIRRKNSVWVNDPVSGVLGGGAIIILCAPILYLVWQDLPFFMKRLKRLRRKLRKLLKIQK